MGTKCLKSQGRNLKKSQFQVVVIDQKLSWSTLAHHRICWAVSDTHNSFTEIQVSKDKLFLTWKKYPYFGCFVVQECKKVLFSTVHCPFCKRHQIRLGLDWPARRRPGLSATGSSSLWLASRDGHWVNSTALSCHLSQSKRFLASPLDWVIVSVMVQVGPA